MTTDVRVRCNGSNYRAVIVDSRYPDVKTYVYSAESEKDMVDNHNPDTTKNVGSDNNVTVTEEYSQTGWNRETDEPLPQT